MDSVILRRNRRMYLTEKGYWVPSKDEVILIQEEPHVIKWHGIKDNKPVRGITIPHAYRDGLQVGTEITIKGTSMHQDMHYEWVSIECVEGSFLNEQYGATTLQIPLRYFERHPDKEYENTYEISE